MKKTIVTACAILLGSIGTMTAQVKLQANNVDEVLKAMTLEEKAMLVVGGNRQIASTDNNGMIGGHAQRVPGAAGTTQAISRLGIPSTVLTDGPAGVRINPRRDNDQNTYFCTGFPVGTALACTWNTQLVEEVGKCIGNEVLEYGCDVLLAPGMNIHRSPLCGRNFEYYSEDPIVTGKIAAAYVRGVQSQGVGVSVKHFAANSQETNRMGVDEVMSQRALREIYLKGFEIAVRESAPWTVMSSYNRINGPFTQENRELLTTILREEWGFDGIVMTDWTGLRNTAAQIQAGNDLMEPGADSQIKDIMDKVKSGVLKESDLDICVKRILQYLTKTPAFRAYKYTNKPDLKAHADVTRRSATEGMVLLKNDGQALPMNNTKTVSVFGITSYDFIAGGTGSGDVNKAYTIDMMQGLTEAGLKVNTKLANLYQSYKNYQSSLTAAAPARGGWFWGKAVLPEMAVSRPIINVQAQESDLAIITLGRQAGEGSDRQVDDDFTLTDVERQLITDVCNAFHLANKPVVVVLNMGNVIETASWKSMPDAILLAWQPGQEGGYSVADVLTGKAYPSGKLTMTWPNNLIDLPSSANFPNVRPAAPRGRGNNKVEFQDYTKHTEDINVGYRYFTTTKESVSYPFGFGLSYTTFSYSKPVVKATKDGLTATITVTNTGKRAGKEVVELYVSAPAGGLEKPARELKAFAKTKELQPNQSETLTMTLSLYDLASYNETTQAWETAAGKYTISFGASVEDIRATAPFNLSKQQVVKCHDVMKPNMQL
ncbi:glycoside hydrolase family 3 C-terminal domain-containing protein [uncultured Prevotella sp.]|uniref:glycoside hydrolase family 3 C-terminal domain-containing protein n=1 Tax=uncultured Prevotella sp. TaxID=159272 RepID=UPI0025CEB606|nr:glycoside hydrolase family 3 C-terminal domain-containing protein [uncultured Prevotella sp.]